jgi:hypothetical protein
MHPQPGNTGAPPHVEWPTQHAHLLMCTCEQWQWPMCLCALQSKAPEEAAIGIHSRSMTDTRSTLSEWALNVSLAPPSQTGGWGGQ